MSSNKYQLLTAQLQAPNVMDIKKRIFISIIQWMCNISFFACGFLGIVDIAMQPSDPTNWLFTQNDPPHPGYPVVRSSITIYPYLVLNICATAFLFFTAALEIRIYGLRYVGFDLNWTLRRRPTLLETLKIMDDSQTRARDTVSLYGKCYEFYFYAFPLILLWNLIALIVTWAAGENVIMMSANYAMFGIIMFVIIFICLIFHTYEFLWRYRIFSPQTEGEFAEYVYLKWNEALLTEKARIEYELSERDVVENVTPEYLNEE